MVKPDKNFLALANAAFQRGELDEAARCLTKHLNIHARDADGFHFLGIVEFQRGKSDRSLAALKKAIFLRPSFAEAHCNRGNIFMKMGRHEEALLDYQSAIDAQPSFGLAHSNRGTVLSALGRHAEALTSFDRALGLDPSDSEAWFGRGNSLVELGRSQEAAAAFLSAIQAKPNFFEAMANRGLALQSLGQNDDAMESFDAAIRINPGYARAHFNRAVLFEVLERFEDALLAYDQCLTLGETSPEIYLNRGTVLKEMGRLPEALECFDKALERRSNYAEAECNRGSVLEGLGRPDEALAAYETALKLSPGHARSHFNRGVLRQSAQQYAQALEDYALAIEGAPDFADAHLNRGHIHLLHAQFQEGWGGYEWRPEQRHFTSSLKLPLLRPDTSVRGKKIFIRWEQGLGDTIQFSRYLSCLADAGAQVFFAPQKPLRGLMQSLRGDITILESDDPDLNFDFGSLLMSLPFVLGTTEEKIPRVVPYLGVEESRVEDWRRLIGKDDFKIGICWQGNANFRYDATRSIPLKEFEAISKIPGVRLISLHKGSGEDQILSMPEGMKVQSLGAEFDSGDNAFLDTAAVMKGLDLVISSDTSIAHLAGAMGVPVWVALGQRADWRWLLDRRDSPWYPTMRLFRQKTEGSWKLVFEEMLDRLTKTPKVV